MDPHTALKIWHVCAYLVGPAIIGLSSLMALHYSNLIDKNPPREITINSETGRTDIFPWTKSNIDQRTNRLLTEKIDPWRMFNTGKMNPITLHNGKTYTHPGAKFDGSVQLVFWALIDPFLKDEIRNTLDSIGKECVDNHVDAKAPLDDAGMLLKGMVEHVYYAMADVDLKIRTSPLQKEKAQRRDVTDKVTPMFEYVDIGRSAPKRCFETFSK